MNPAVCAVCSTTAAAEEDHGEAHGGWVQFAGHTGTDEPGLSHPEGLAYFCAAHHPAAQALAGRSCAEAVAWLRAQNPTPCQAASAVAPPARRWWQFWRT